MKKQIRLLAGALWLLTMLALSQAFAQTSPSGSVAPTTTTASELGSVGLDAPPTLGDQRQTADDGSAQAEGTPVVKSKSDRPEDDSTADPDAPEANTDSESRTQGVGPNEFQKFVAESSGKLLPMFGQSLFDGVPSTFAPLNEAPVSSDYIVGPGDEVIIRTWGQVDVHVRTVVDRNGMLIIPRVGAISVAGVRNHELEKLVRQAISRIYRNFELIVNLGKLRALQVFIVGQARRPGSFTVSPLSTLVSTLFASGGPSAQGTMRRIVVKRANKVVTEFDLYDMLLKGDTSKDVRLQQGDVIFIPPIGPLVAMMGSVNAPAIYELKRDNDTTLSDLLGWAGGITTTASDQRAVLERIVDRQVRTLVEVSLDREGLNQKLSDGDIVNIYPIQSRVANAVALRGFVNQPARVPWREGMRIKDLIPEKEAMLTPDYWRQRQQIISFRGESLTRQTGAVGELRFADEVNWEYAVVERLREDLTTVLIPFNLGQAVVAGDPKHNLLLLPNDVVVIFAKSEVRSPIDSRKKYVHVEGEFVQGGVYQALPGETLRQLVTRAGGVTERAYLFGASFTRQAVKAQQQSQLDELVNRAEQELLRSAVQVDASTASSESAILNRAQQQNQQALLGRMRRANATGRVVLGLFPGASVNDLPDIALENGDRIYVPAQPSLVNVLGSVFNQNSFIYKDGTRLSDYLALAGGATKDADEDSIYLLRVDGTVVSRRQKSWFASLGTETILPGDAIFVPPDLERYAFTREFKDWTQILYQFALGVAGLKILRD